MRHFRILAVCGLLVASGAARANEGQGSADEIAREVAHDRAGDHYFNKPGATSTDYDRDWQMCRRIADGEVTPHRGMSGAGDGLPNAQQALKQEVESGPNTGLAQSILLSLISGGVARQKRDDNRRSCMLITGWR